MSSAELPEQPNPITAAFHVAYDLIADIQMLVKEIVVDQLEGDIFAVAQHPQPSAIWQGDSLTLIGVLEDHLCDCKAGL